MTGVRGQTGFRNRCELYGVDWEGTGRERFNTIQRGVPDYGGPRTYATTDAPYPGPPEMTRALCCAHCRQTSPSCWTDGCNGLRWPSISHMALAVE